MVANTRAGTFSKNELGLALIAGLCLEVLFFLTLSWTGDSKIEEKKEIEPIAIPINVKPVVDELPLLKLGSKQTTKPKLPDMWKKATPTPVRRLEERSAPSAQAEENPTELPKSKLADKDHPAPTKDDEIVKEAPVQLEDKEQPDQPQLNTEGAADGSPDGTETDPLKARAVDLYKQKIAAWFNSRFKQPVDAIPCDTLKGLSARVRVSVGGERAITGFALTGSSGNAVFDGKVSAFLAGIVGQQLPPPPPLYPDILESSIFPILSGAGASCAASTPAPKPQTPSTTPAPSTPAPSTPAPSTPAPSTPAPSTPPPAPRTPAPAPSRDWGKTDDSDW